MCREFLTLLIEFAIKIDNSNLHNFGYKLKTVHFLSKSSLIIFFLSNYFFYIYISFYQSI